MFDTNETGYIDLRKMMLVIIALSSGDPEENVEMMFYIVDLNNDGVITAEVKTSFCFKLSYYILLKEYQIVTKDIFLLANEKKISTANNKDHLTKSSFNEMDSNLDGQIDLREFRRACDRHNYIIFHYLKNFVTTYRQMVSS